MAVVGVALAGRDEPAVLVAPKVDAAPSTDVTARASVAERPAMPRRREAGTDGLMGRLPLDLPPDPVAPLVNRFAIDDVRVAWSDLDTTPPWVRRLHSLGSYTADPYQR